MLARLLRTWGVTTIGCLPLLVLHLVPQLMRSRAGSETLLIAGMELLAVLLLIAALAAPVFSALAAPAGHAWRPQTAIPASLGLWRSARGASMAAIGIFAAGYLLAQVLGYAVGVLVPPFADAPGGGWELDYSAYALQAIVTYLFVVLAFTGAAERLRAAVVKTAVPVA